MNVKIQWATPEAKVFLFSLSDKILIAAKEKGYSADLKGNIFSPKKKLLRGGKTKQGYKTFTPSAYPEGKRGCVLQHRFVAFFHFGFSVFANACVRHINDIPSDNRVENLCLGSYQDNARDIPETKRKQRSAGAAERIREQNRKLSDSQVIEMRNLRLSTDQPFKKIAEQFGVSTMTAYRAITGKAWNHL